MAWLAPPLPPNRTGGFPASGSPVSGVSVRLTIGTRAVFQTEQPLCRKPAIGPAAAVGEPGQHAFGPDRVFYPLPAGADVSGLFRLLWASHWRRSGCLVSGHVLHASTFLHPLAPRTLFRFNTTMDALTPARRHSRRSGPGGSPCLLRPHFQPFCPQPPRHLNHGICVRSRLLCSGSHASGPDLLRRSKDCFLHGSWRGLRTTLAGSPVGAAESGLLCVMSGMSRRYGRVVHFRQISTSCHHDAVAFSFRRVNVPPYGDLHPVVCTPSQAHACGRPGHRNCRCGCAWGPLRHNHISTQAISVLRETA